MASMDQLIESLRAINSSSFTSDDDRLHFQDELRSAMRRVQSPWDVAWEQVWVNGLTMAAIKTLIDVGVFSKWAENGSKPTNAEGFAQLTGADAPLLKRLLRQVAAESLILDTGNNTYTSTPWALRVGTESTFASIYGSFYHDIVSPLYLSLPYFLNEAGYQNPTDIRNSNFQRIHGKGSSFFSYVSSDSLRNQHFADTMDCHSQGNFTSWVDLYDTSQIMSGQTDRPLVVDIGGSKGHDIEKFLQKFPDVPEGSLILQDLPEVLEKFTINPRVTPYAYDFFTPQPVKGARIYYLHVILHDWPDHKVTEILKIVRDAMDPGYSKLLIHEVLVSEESPPLTVTTLDLTMMAAFSALERTEGQLRDLIGGIEDLKIVKIWKARQAVESIIEIERV